MPSDAVLVLLVEDEPELREAVGEYLGLFGFVVTAVGSAAEGLEAAARLQPHVILSDLSLPDERGEGFLLSVHHQNPSALLYVHSGQAGYQPSAELAACGVTPEHVFCKPTNLGAVAKTLRSHLNL